MRVKPISDEIRRRVIAELREPTEAMLDAGTEQLWPGCRGWLPGSKAVETFQAMLDAASAMSAGTAKTAQPVEGQRPASAVAKPDARKDIPCK